MGPVVVSVVLVGACIAIGVWYAVAGGRPQGATAGAGSGRGTATVRWWVRLRSGVVLACLSTLLGLALAAAVLLVLALLFVLLQSSVG